MASLPYSSRERDFIFQYRKILQPPSLFTSAPQVVLMWNFNCVVLCAITKWLFLWKEMSQNLAKYPEIGELSAGVQGRVTVKFYDVLLTTWHSYVIYVTVLWTCMNDATKSKVKVKKANLYSTLYISFLSLKRSGAVRPACNKGITVLPATHTWTIPAFAPHLQGITALWRWGGGGFAPSECFHVKIPTGSYTVNCSVLSWTLSACWPGNHCNLIFFNDRIFTRERFQNE